MAYNSKFTGAQIDALLDASEAMQTSKEDAANKVTSIGADADDTHYPSAKAVKDAVEVPQKEVTELFHKILEVNQTITNNVTNSWSQAFPVKIIKGQTYHITTNSAMGNAAFAFTNNPGSHVASDEIQKFIYNSNSTPIIEYVPSVDSEYLWIYAGNDFLAGEVVSIKNVSSLESCVKANIEDAQDAIVSLNKEVGLSKRLITESASNWQIDCKFTAGVNYRLSNNGDSGAITAKLFDEYGTNVQTISSAGIGAHQSVEFVANDNAAYIGGYANAANIVILIESIDGINPAIANLESDVKGVITQIGFDKTFANPSGIMTAYPLKLQKDVSYTIKNKTSDAIKGYTLDSNNVSSEHRLQTIIDAGAGAENTFVAVDDTQYIGIYTVSAGDVHIYADSTILPRLNNVINKSEQNAEKTAELNKAILGTQINGQLSVGVDKGENFLIDISENDSIRIDYFLSTEDMSVIGVYGINDDDTKTLLSQVNNQRSGTIRFTAHAHYKGIRIYAQRGSSAIGQSTLDVTIIDYIPSRLISSSEIPGVDYISVTDFGADKTGTYDSIESIRNAIDSAIALHKSVYFPYGKYLVSEPIFIKTNEPLVLFGFAKEMSGSGNGTTITATQTMDYIFRFENNGTATKFHIKDMMLNGASKVNNIVEVKTGYFEMERVFCINSIGNGVYANDCYYLKIKDVTITHCNKNGLYLYGQANVVNIVDCQINSNASGGVGYANIKADMDTSTLINKNCNILINSCDISSPDYNVDGNSSVHLKNCLAVAIKNCYLENSTQNEQSDNYYHIIIEDSVDSCIVEGNFIGMGSCSINSKSGVIMGNDFCTRQVYGQTNLNGLRLEINSNVQELGNYFWTGYTKEIIN